MKWPVVPGRYRVGNPESPVAVCTLKDVDLEVGGAAICGPCMTENIGIEKVVKNVISNPNIRFLVLCGNEPRGHFVGQALRCLKENGVDEGNRIIGASGAMPFVKNLSKDEIERFRNQVEIIDMIGVTDTERINGVVEECIRKNPGPFRGAAGVRDVPEVEADFDHEREIKLDEKGWFTISVDRTRNLIVVEHYMGYGKDAGLNCRIVGRTVEEIAGTIVKMGLISDLYHAAYLGKELQKAEMALRTGKRYEQDRKIF